MGLDAIVVPQMLISRTVRRPATIVDFLAGRFEDWEPSVEEEDNFHPRSVYPSINPADAETWRPYVIATYDDTLPDPIVIHRRGLWYERLDEYGLCAGSRAQRNPESLIDAARAALVSINAAAQRSGTGQLPRDMARARTLLAIALSAHDDRIIGGSSRDMEIARYVTAPASTYSPEM